MNKPFIVHHWAVNTTKLSANKIIFTVKIGVSQYKVSLSVAMTIEFDNQVWKEEKQCG